MNERENRRYGPPEESSHWAMWFIIVLALLLAAGAWWWWRQAGTPVPASVLPAPSAAVAPAEQAPAPGPHNPMDALVEPDDALPALANADDYVAASLNELMGKNKVASMLQIDGFVRRVVATVDNLPRDPAPARMWPVNPTAERFTVHRGDGGDGVSTIAPDNFARYNSFVRAVEAVDVQGAAALYGRLYPLFQQAYEELGYPGKYFNDRLVAVIDHLLQAPEPEGPVQVTVTEVKGDFPSTRPWVRYEYVDPDLQALSSGQKIMVRVGLAHERRLKQRLRALRAAVTTAAVAKPKP